MDWIVFLHAFVFLAFWLTNLIFQQEVNEFLSDATGLRLPYLLIFIIFTALVGLWSAIRLGLKKNSRKAGPAWLSRLVSGFYLLFFYGSFIVLFLKNPLQVARLGQFVQYFVSLWMPPFCSWLPGGFGTGWAGRQNSGRNGSLRGYSLSCGWSPFSGHRGLYCTDHCPRSRC